MEPWLLIIISIVLTIVTSVVIVEFLKDKK